MARERDEGSFDRPAPVQESAHKWCSYVVGPGERTCPFLSSAGSNERALCTWHWRVRVDARNTFEEFEDWCLMLYGTGKPLTSKPHMIDAGYCCVWTHWAPGALWDLMHGRVADIGPPFPCRLASCRNAPEPMMTPADATKIRRQLDRAGWADEIVTLAIERVPF